MVAKRQQRRRCTTTSRNRFCDCDVVKLGHSVDVRLSFILGYALLLSNDVFLRHALLLRGAIDFCDAISNCYSVELCVRIGVTFTNSICHCLYDSLVFSNSNFVGNWLRIVLGYRVNGRIFDSLALVVAVIDGFFISDVIRNEHDVHDELDLCHAF